MGTLRTAGAILAASAALILSSCAGGPAADAPAGHSLGSLLPGPPEGEVIGQGMVMETSGDVKLCLGPIAESYPPQCSGMPLHGWTWEGVDGSESSDDVRWGMYAVTGTYDGTAFTQTSDPIPLALYDPMAPEDPTGGVPGNLDESRLIEIQDSLPDHLGPDVLLSAGPHNGYLWVDVVWDDGTLQKAADDDFGADAVIIRSALQPVG